MIFDTSGLSGHIFKSTAGTSLMVQWLRLQAPNAGGLGSIPGQGTRSHMLQRKIPRVRQRQLEISTKISTATKTRCNLSKEKEKRENGIAKGSLEAGQSCEHVTHQFYKAQSLPLGVAISISGRSLITMAGSEQK